MMKPSRPKHYAAPNEMVILVLDRTGVERCDIEGTLQTLQGMAASAGTARAYANRIHLTFSGYDTDPREVCDIPAIRTFVRALTGEFPYWNHFLNLTDDTYILVFRCLMNGTVPLEPQGDGESKAEFDMNEMKRVMFFLFDGTNELYERLGLSEEENVALTDKVVEYIQAHVA